MIDKKAIRIRPYTEEDKDQVLQTLALGFSMVGDRIFQKTIRHRSTALTILSKSLVYTLIVELAIVTLSTVNSSSSSSSSSGRMVLEDLRAMLATLTEPESIQSLLNQFMLPSSILLGLAITLLVTLATIYSLYSRNQQETERYIQGCLEDDLGDITAYYQKDVVTAAVSKQQDKKSTTTTTTTRKNRSHFWVACLDSHPQLVLGCISLDDVVAHGDALLAKHLKQGGTEANFHQPSKDDAELRRLSVHPDYRRLGIGKMLMQTLRDSAKKQGFKRVILSTTVYQSEALVGYIRFGFERDRFVKITELFTLWYGKLELNATEKEKDAQREMQPVYLGEVGLIAPVKEKDGQREAKPI